MSFVPPKLITRGCAGTRSLRHIPAHILWVHQLREKSENIPCFLAIRYIVGRAMAKNWLLKVGFKLKNCKFREEHAFQALFLLSRNSRVSARIFFAKSSNKQKTLRSIYSSYIHWDIFFQTLQSVSRLSRLLPSFSTWDTLDGVVLVYILM